MLRREEGLLFRRAEVLHRGLGLLQGRQGMLRLGEERRKGSHLLRYQNRLLRCGQEVLHRSGKGH